MPQGNLEISFYFLIWMGEVWNKKLLVPVMALNDTKASSEEVLKRIQCNCKGELCIFFQHATAYSKQLGLH